MSTPCSPRWTRGSAASHRASYADPDLRVSNAERAEIADRLSRHYGDGRLDQAEFNERLDQAMRATTQSDLSGLYADLPGTEVSGEAARHRHGHPHHRIGFLVLVIVITAAVGQALVRSYIPWLLIGVLAFFWLRFGPWRHRRR